jgi:Zn-dependent M28 family amino/carboxypeptidase
MYRSFVRLFFLATVAWAAGDLPSPRFDPQHYLAHIKYLASPDLKGRESGSPELTKAAEYIARQFKAAGLRPIDGKSYFQTFNVTSSARLGKHNDLGYTIGDKKTSAKPAQFLPLNFSSSGEFTGQLVFAGFGITAKEYGYDDYAGIDAKDKFVIVLRHEPQEFDDKSVFSGKVYTEHAQFFSKAVNAKMHGAKGVILVNDTANHADADDLEAFATTAGPTEAGIPYIQVKAEVVNQWLATAGPHGGDVKSLQAEIDKDLHNMSFALPDNVTVTIHTDVRRDSKPVNNVVGYLPGETDEHVVIGAHYDHLGAGHQFSMAPSMAGTTHPGADDNASGTAGVIELARYFGSQPKHKRGIVFMTFAGEELGLLGSGYYVNNPRLPISNDVAMINMDMIGRIRDGKVYLGGLGTGDSFNRLIDEAAKGSTLTLERSDSTGYGSSDHTSFTTKQVPVLFFFSGLHADYHKPSDTWDKIDAPEAVKLLEVVAGITTHLIDDPARPQFVRVAPPPKPVSSSGSSSGGGYGPYFGSIPDMAETKGGVKFADVREGSPAGKAGLKGGDMLVEFDGKKIDNLYDFTYALRAKQVGDTVKVKVVRAGQTIEADVLLERRR